MNAAISVENLGKSYVIRHEQPQRYSTLRDTLMEQVKNVGRKVLIPRRHVSSSTVTKEQFWALKGVNFTIEEGERLGIIGRNGAGKSTLLKILSRITEPTEGRIEIRGRVSSLLEVGTGFHPELTGRENIFLNGAVLGMQTRDIRRRFDEIVAFAEIERFLDTPVKRYSSGMYVRLAFAVAAHLDPDVLVLDEVLAVGDFKFQRKCFGKIRELGTSAGRTIVFVSHSMSSVSAICSKALLLEEGRVAAYGPIQDVIQSYEEQPGTLMASGRIDLRYWKMRSGGDVHARVLWGEVDFADASTGCLYIGRSIRFSFGVGFESERVGKPVKLAVMLRTAEGIPVANMIGEDSGFAVESVRGEEAFSIVLRDIRFYPGVYLISFWVGSMESATWDCVNDCISFEVTSGGDLARRRLPRDAGLLFLTPEWERLT